MALLLLLPILVCGFLYLRIHQKHRHSFSKIEGQHLYFKSAFHGFIFTLSGFAVYIILNKCPIFIDLSYYIKNSVFQSIYSIDISDIKNTSKSDIQSLEQYRGLTTLNFYNMLIWITFLSVILIYLYVHLSFFVRVLYEWSIQWIKLFWNTFVLKLFALILTILKTFSYFIYLVFILILNIIFSKKDVFKITPNEFDTNNSLDKNHIGKLKVKTNTLSSFSSIWKSWKYGIISINEEIKDPLDQLLYKSIHSHQSMDLIEENQIFDDKAKPVMVTMDDRKVYIGIVIGFGYDTDAFSIKNDTFRFLPLKSGYRDKDTLKVIATTDYVKTIQNLEKLKTIELILRKENIVSITLFNLDRFNMFQNSQTMELSTKSPTI